MFAHDLGGLQCRQSCYLFGPYVSLQHRLENLPARFQRAEVPADLSGELTRVRLMLRLE
jgi:hypothetical protein